MVEKKLELKGKNVKRLKPEQKKKMEETLERMNKTRDKDTRRLRVKIEEAIKASIEEVKKADNYIAALTSKIQETQNMKLRNEGVIISLGEILKNDTEDKN